MRFFNKLSVRNKILLMIAIPFTAIGILVFQEFYDARAEIADADEILLLADVSRHVGGDDPRASKRTWYFSALRGKPRLFGKRRFSKTTCRYKQSDHRKKRNFQKASTTTGFQPTFVKTALEEAIEELDTVSSERT